MADVIKYRFVLRRGLAADWTAKNEVLLQGEFGLELDTGLGKIGDGTTPWNSLPYTIVGQVDLDGLADGKCLAWDATAGIWKVANRGAVYQPGAGIDIDSSDPENPVISSTLGSIHVDDQVADYASLPSPPPSGKTAYYVESDRLIYIWNGTAYPAEGGGVALSSLDSFTGDPTFASGGTVAVPSKIGKYLQMDDADGTWLIPAYKLLVPVSTFTDTFATDSSSEYDSLGDMVATWAIASGVLTGTGGMQALFVRKEISFADGQVSAVCLAARDAGFVFRFQDNNNYYVAVISDQSSGGSTPNSIKLYKRVGGAYTQLGATATISFPTNSPQTLAVQASGTSITVYFNGSAVITVTDSAISAAGKIGLRTNGGTAKFDSFGWSY